MLFKETSLLLTAFALLGLLMCALAGRAGARKSSLVAALLCVTIAVASLVPVAQATKTASAEGVPLSLTGYFADLVSGTGALRGPFPGRPCRTPDREERSSKSDVWEPPGGDAKVPAAAPDRTPPRKGDRR